MRSRLNARKGIRLRICDNNGAGVVVVVGEEKRYTLCKFFQSSNMG